jgi:hypothetical protein
VASTPTPQRRYSHLNPSLYVYECETPRGLGEALFPTLVALHAPIVVWALHVAWTTRGHVAELNEVRPTERKPMLTSALPLTLHGVMYDV